MEYFIKVSSLIAVFYIFYKVILQKETFFQSNRAYLLLGIVTSFTIPFITITKYEELVEIPVSHFTNVSTTRYITEVPTEIQWDKIVLIIYGLGILYFLVQFLISLISIIRLISLENKESSQGFVFIKTTKNMAPCSFFNYIIYNESHFEKEELIQIINHEKIHAYQWHSIDIILSQLVSIVFWCNPFSWLYKKEVVHNLEYIADAATQQQANCHKSYQKLLLKTSINDGQLTLTNNFYNSFIKKRIIMLHKNPSKQYRQLKMLLIVPFLVAFVFAFNTIVVAQKPNFKEIEVVEKSKEEKPTVKEIKVVKQSKTSKSTPDIIEIDNDVHDYIITKDTKDLEKLKSQLSAQGVTAKFKGVKRNSKGEITAIKVDLKSKATSANFAQSGDKPIQPIKISFEDGGAELSLGSSTTHNVFIREKESTKNNVWVIRDTDEKIHEINPDSDKIIEIKKDGDHQVIEIKGEGASSSVWVTKGEDADKIIEIKTGDGKHEIIEIKKEGESDTNVWVSKDGEHEVIEIKTGGEHDSFKIKKDDVIEVHPNDSNSFVYMSNDKKGQPLFVIDGKIVEDLDTNKLDKLIDPNDIESMNVLKGESAEKKYGDKGKNGVIEIITKKQ
ncbi:hypothetical protein KH5_16360 [Urechidicola sp. KH5]